VEPVPFMVIKQDGRREPFDRDKILKGLLKACQKRPISPQKLEELADSVETVLADQPDREISTAQIGEMLMNRLYALDEVAYVRFASVYRRFENAREFLAEVMKVIDARQEG
jgi:transcriptional repressor NrdR